MLYAQTIIIKKKNQDSSMLYTYKERLSVASVCVNSICNHGSYIVVVIVITFSLFVK